MACISVCNHVVQFVGNYNVCSSYVLVAVAEMFLCYLIKNNIHFLEFDIAESSTSCVT